LGKTKLRFLRQGFSRKTIHLSLSWRFSGKRDGNKQKILLAPDAGCILPG
jgi:hypothetical protein